MQEMISARSKQAQDTCRSIKLGCNEIDKKIMALNSTHSARMQKADKTLEAKVSFACTKEGTSTFKFSKFCLIKGCEIQR